MMPAAKHFDPVLGVDIHIVQPPGPVPPVPIPHPFVGMLLDVMDYLPFVGATVFVAGMPRAQAGTAGKNVPPHIPIGGMFIKWPGNECEMFMGSATVEVDGDAFSHLGLPVLSCQDIGVPPPPRLKRQSRVRSLVLPTSVVLAIPTGVFVGGPPTISIMALAMRAGMAKAGRLFKKFRAARKAKKAQKAKPKAKASGTSKGNAPCGTDAHPVDVVTGACVDTLVDYRREDGSAFHWTRHYDSSWSGVPAVMGRGFRHGFEMSLVRIPGGLRFTSDTGEVTDFELEPGQERGAGGVALAGGFILRILGPAEWEVIEPRERILRFRSLFPGGGGVLSEVREGGRLLDLGYDGQGRLQFIRDGAGTVFPVEHDAAGRIVAVHEGPPPGSQGAPRTLLRFEYDADGCLSTVRDALGHVATYGYEAGRLTRMRDRRGYYFHYIYDADGRVVHTTGEDGLWNARFEYLPEARMTVVHYGDGGTWTKFHDESGMVTDVVHPDGGLLVRRMGEDGRVAEEVDQDGEVSTWQYDGTGALEGVRDSLGRLRPPPWIDPEVPDYDAPDPPLTAAEREYGGKMAPDGPTPGRIPARLLPELPEGARDALGLTRFTGGLPRPQVVLDEMGRRSRVEYPDGTAESWTRDPEGNWIQFTDRDGSVHRRSYRSWNLLQAEADPLGQVSRYEHSLRGQITRFTDPGGTMTEFTRDAQERIVAVQRAGEVRESYRWSPAGRFLEMADAGGRVRVRDVLTPSGLAAQRICADGGGHASGYDESGRVVLAASGDVVVRRAFEPLGRHTLDQVGGDKVEHLFDWEGVASTTVLGSFLTRYDYRGAWEWDVTDPTGAVHTVRIHPEGLGIRRLSSGRVEVAHFGEGGRCLGKHLADVAGGRPWTRVFIHSGTGRLLEVRDSAEGVTRYAWDAAHRLVGEATPSGEVRQIRLDAAGNVLALPGHPQARIGPGNRLEARGGERFEYDLRHNLSARTGPSGTIRYVRDDEDRLVRIEGGAGGVWEAGYDPFGRRLWKARAGERTEFVWDGDRLAAERDPDGRLRVYVYPDERSMVPLLFVDYPDAKADPATGERRFVFTNQIGVPVRVEDDAGDVLWAAEVEPYGAVRIAPGARVELNLRFPGHYFDPETGLHYNRFRYYSPELGRYLESDPIGLAGGDNVYAYPANPLVEVDVLGLSCKDPAGKTRRGREKPNGKAENPFHSDARAKHQDVGELSHSVGMKPNHVKALQHRAASQGERIIIRASNPESLKWHNGTYDGLPCVAKPVTVKHKTAKPPDPHAGLVKYEAGADPPPKGFRWDENGVMRDPNGSAVHGDYDLQGVYRSDRTGVNTNDEAFTRKLNLEVCPEHPQFKHGANDDYWPILDKEGKPTTITGGDRPGRNPEADESFLVVEPNGTAKRIDGTHNLQRYYEDVGIDWPYPPY